jgi:hypothetical protein
LTAQLAAPAFLGCGAITLTPLAASSPPPPEPSVRNVEAVALINPKVVSEASYVFGVRRRADEAASGEETL